MKRKAVFIDRDGVLNRDPGAEYYVRTWERFAFLPRTAEALAALKGAGYRLYVVSNQSGVARGDVSAAELARITENMKEALRKHGASLDGVYYCRHDDADRCACRKPKTGLFTEAAQAGGIDLASSYNVGDSERDIVAGKSLGLASILVLSGKTRPENVKGLSAKPDHVATDLFEASQWIIQKKF